MLDFFQGMQALVQKLPNAYVTAENFLPFVILGDELVLIQSIQNFSRKILNKAAQNNIQIKSFNLENTQASCDELKFLLQEQDLFGGQSWFFIDIAKTGKYINEFLKQLHLKYGQQKNYHIFLPHLDKATKESPWFTEFSKHHQSIYLPKLNLQPQFFRQWLIFEAGQYRLELSNDCLIAFEQNCHHNLMQAQQVLKQLYLAYVLAGKSENGAGSTNPTPTLASAPSSSRPQYITLSDVKPYLSQHSEYEFGDIVNAMWLGQSQKMLRACEYLMQKETPHLLIWLLNDDFIKLQSLLEQKRHGIGQGTAANFKSLNIWGDKQKALNRVLGLYNIEALNIFWQQLLILERKAKGIGSFDANIWQAVIAFLLQIIKPQR